MALLEALYRFIDTILSLSGILFNATLIYCIQNRSPKSISTYSFLLMNTAISSLLVGIAAVFVQPRLIIQDDNAYFIANGFCSLFGARYCFLGYGAMVSIYGHLTISLLASYIYRWYILRWSNPDKRTMGIVVFLISIPPPVTFFVGTVPLILAASYSTSKAEIAQIHPEQNVDTYTTFGISHAVTDFRAIIPVAWVWLPVIPITITVFWIRSLILKHLAQHVNLHEQTRKVHRNLLKALTLQALLPPIYHIAMSLAIVDFLFQFHHPIFEYGVFFLCGWVAILSPLFPLYFITPYRRFLRSLFFKQTNKIDVSSSNNITALSNRSQRSLVIRY